MFLIIVSLGTKQAIKGHQYDQLEVSDVLRKCLNWSCQAPDPTVPDPAYCGAAKVFLVHIFVILIALILNCRTEDIKKGFKHLGQHPNLAECMKFCPEYHNAVGPERARLDKIVADSLECMREHGEIADTFFDAKVHLLVF